MCLPMVDGRTTVAASKIELIQPSWAVRTKWACFELLPIFDSSALYWSARVCFRFGRKYRVYHSTSM